MKKTINSKNVEQLKLPPKIKTTLKAYMTIMDNEWGENRNYNLEGGYAIQIESPLDYEELEKIYIDVRTDIAEFVDVIIEETGEEHLICLFIMNEDFNIVLVIPKEYAHENLLSQIRTNRVRLWIVRFSDIEYNNEQEVRVWQENLEFTTKVHCIM